MPQNQPAPSQTVINTQSLGHAEVVATARKNQQAQKRPRTTKKPLVKQPRKQIQQQQMKHKSPRSPKRTQWLKNAKVRLTKPSSSSIFEQKSKAAALQQSRESESRADRNLRYSSPSDNKSFTSVNKAKLKFSPTVKKHSIEPDSPGTPPFEIVTSSDPNDFINDNNELTQASTVDHPSCSSIQPNQTCCSYSQSLQKRPQGIMKLTPRMDKIVAKIWTQPNHETTAIEDSSADDFPIQPPIKKIEVVYLDTTTSENTTNPNVPMVEISDDHPPANDEVPQANKEEPQANEEEPRPMKKNTKHLRPPRQKARYRAFTQAIFTIKMNFKYHKILIDGGLWCGSRRSPGTDYENDYIIIINSS